MLDFLDIVEQNLFGLRREIENHVDVEGIETRCRIADTFENLFARTIFLAAVHLREQLIVEALHAYRKAIHAPAQRRKPGVHEVVRVGFAGNFFDIEIFAGHIDSVAELVEQNGRRTAAEVQAFEVVAHIFEHHHFATKVLEVRSRGCLAEGVAVEAAIGAQHLAERHVQVQHVFVSRFGAGQEFLGCGVDNEMALRDVFDNPREHAFAQHESAPCV